MNIKQEMNLFTMFNEIDLFKEIEQQYNIPEDIKNIIKSYLFDVNLFKDTWRNKILKTLSIVDRGIELIPLYYVSDTDYYYLLAPIILNEYYCLECYLETLFKRQKYINNINCITCNDIQNNKEWWTNMYRSSYDRFKKSYNLNSLKKSCTYDFTGIKIFIKSNTHLTEMILSGKLDNYKLKDLVLLLCKK